MTILTDQVIREELGIYGVSSTADTFAKIRAYMLLLLRWNQKISLTTVTDPLEILRFHFGESMFPAAKLLNKNGRLADVGAGAGFPGFPLKIAIPTLDLVLIESNAKKAAFLDEIIRELNMHSVQVYRGRFEDFKAPAPGFDFITARALGAHDKLLDWARGATSAGGSVVLWLGEDDALQVSKRDSWRWRDPMLIPGSQRRTVLIGVPS